MKAKKRIRILRALAIAGSLSAVALPSAASAKPVSDPHPVIVPQRGAVVIPVRHENGVSPAPNHVKYSNTWLPGSNFHVEAQTPNPAPQKPYSLPASFKPEVQTPNPAPQKPFSLPASFKPEVQTPGSPVASTPAGSVVREIRTVTDDGGRTLAIVLAAIALAVALGGTAWVLVRQTRMQRQLLGSSRPLAS
jgi:hypothetical protein